MSAQMTFRFCEHPRVPENTKPRANGKGECRACLHARRARDAVLRGVPARPLVRSPLCAACSSPRGKHGTYCNPCAAMHQRRRNPPKERDVTTFKRCGHPRTPDNMKWREPRAGKSGFWLCRACRRRQIRDYAVRMRERAGEYIPRPRRETPPRCFEKPDPQSAYLVRPQGFGYKRSERANPDSVLHKDLAKWAKQYVVPLRRAA